MGFLAGLFLLSAATMAYEILLTRLLSVVTWYYLALVAVGMAMSGITAGALAVQLKPRFFEEARLGQRLRQGASAMGVAIPIALLSMLAVPLALSLSLEVVYSFLLFTSFAALPFFFSGVAVCLALTRSPMPIGRVYLADLIGAAAGCLASIPLLEVLGAPGAILTCAAITFAAAAAFAIDSAELKLARRNLVCAAAIALAAGLNAVTLYGIEPVWNKGILDKRLHLIAENWNPISMVKASGPFDKGDTYMFGPSPKMPPMRAPFIDIQIDNFADTPMYRRQPGGPSQFAFLNYDVTSFAYLFRGGGSAAILGAGGGRDALAAWVNGFTRIAGVEVNGAIVDLDRRRLSGWGGLNSIPGLEIIHDEGRSFISSGREKFDVIQASMIDTEAATAAGAMTMTENSLYTVDAWRIFYNHLVPGGMLSFSRWAPPGSPQVVETLRIFALGWDTLLREGAAHPADHLALIRSGAIATLLVRNQPFSSADLQRIRRIAEDKQYQILYVPGQAPIFPELEQVLHAKTSAELARLRYRGVLSFAPVYDSSPFFFSFVGPFDVLHTVGGALGSGISGNVQALAFLLLFAFASVVLLAAASAIPMTRMAARPAHRDSVLGAASAYFVAIGLGFMFAEVALMQQLTLLVGTPAYSLITVLAGLIFFAGLGSLASDHLPSSARVVRQSHQRWFCSG